MTAPLTDAIRRAVTTADRPVAPPASAIDLATAEADLGFPLPDLLRGVLTGVANGGFGPGDGLAGVGPGGHRSDLGDLPGGYRQIRADKASLGQAWPDGMLPLCGWGCTIFSCVDCSTEEVWTLEDFELDATGYDLTAFFTRWLDGEADTLRHSSVPRTTHRRLAVNPFTGEPMEIVGTTRAVDGRDRTGASDDRG